jgi:photosystem II stability/assembly factor-like uncharacterized protein
MPYIGCSDGWSGCAMTNFPLNLRTTIVGAVLLAILCLTGGAAKAQFVDPIDAPAIAVHDPERQPLIAIEAAGDHLVAVGPRGVILVSKPAASTASDWVQASVPVQSDLVAVHFVDALNGWATGFDGVILHTADGGAHWTKELDDVSAKTIFENEYKARIAAGDQALSTDLLEVQLNFKDAGLPWLGVSFENSLVGYTVGPFGNLAKTDDGGKSWIPWLDHIDDPNWYNLNAIAEIDGDIYITGEQGLVYRLDRATQTFVQLPTGYDGSFFGITGDMDVLIAFGLRGTIYRSTDRGKTWTAVEDQNGSTILKGLTLKDGTIVLAAVNGAILISSDEGSTFRESLSRQKQGLTDLVASFPGEVILTGLEGISHAPLN